MSHKKGDKVSVVLLGALGSGKSAITVKYTTRRFIWNYCPTLEESYSHIDTIDGQDYIIKIRDTYYKGQCSVEKYLKDYDSVMVVYSITDRASFEVAQKYLDALQQSKRGVDVPTLLVGNKSDMDCYRQVAKKEGISLASIYGCGFLEASAADDYNSISKLFRTLVCATMATKGNRDSSVFINPEVYPQLTSEMGSVFIGEDKPDGSHVMQRNGKKLDHKPKGLKNTGRKLFKRIVTHINTNG